MKRISCVSHRGNICLLAAGVLPEGGRVEVENHLSTCAGCRKHYEEITLVAAPLADWERHFDRVEPDLAWQARWRKAVQVAATQKAARGFDWETILSGCWRELIWPCRRIWTGLAAVWILIFVFNFSQRDRSEIMARKMQPPTSEMILAFRQQESLLAELIGPAETHVAEPPKTFMPRPRSERIEILAT